MTDDTNDLDFEMLLRPMPAGEAMTMIFRDNMNLSFEKVSQATGVSINHLEDIAIGKARIDDKTASKLASVFGETANLLLRMQFVYESVADGGQMPADEQVYAISTSPS